jgi:glycogen debranching enzyme
MARKMLFDPEEYRELTPEEHSLLQVAYPKAVEALERNVTPGGFTACSLADNTVYGTDANYRAVWARDGAKTVIWTSDLEHEAIAACRVATLRTILDNQAPNGQIPCYVQIDDSAAEFGGVGGITAIDAGLWIVIAVWRYTEASGDWSLVAEYAPALERTMSWLRALDSNNCGMLEIPEAGDWTDLFARSYHVLYDEVLWYRCLFAYGKILKRLGDEARGQEFERQAAHVRRVILRNFWPSTAPGSGEGLPSFAEVQFGLGDARYLVAQISPFNFSWKCDVYANLLAFLMSMVDHERAMMTFRFLWGVGVNEPWPVKNLYPPVQAGDPEWREYFTVNLLNLPNHYHNGGIWPFIGGLWVRYIHKLGMKDLARRELVKLARLCSLGVTQEWEFNEWHHAETGRPMGKAYQAWSAASFIKTCHYLHADPESLESDD